MIGRVPPRSGKRRAAAWGVALSVLLLAVAGLWATFSSWRFVDRDQGTVGDSRAVALEAETTAGQTFIARHAGLVGMDVWLEPAHSLPVTLTLHLRSEPGAAADLASATVQLPVGTAPGHQRFTFAALPDSHGRYYYALLEANGSGVSVPVAEGDRYLDGAAYEDGTPLDAQAAFRLVYAPGWVTVGVLKEAAGWLGLLALTAFLFVVPGWALLDGLRARQGLSWAETLGVAAGLGLALYPLILLWSDLVRVRPGALLAWVPGALGLALLAWKHRRWRPLDGLGSWRRWRNSAVFWPDVGLVAVLALVFGVRLLVVGTLEAPLWGDSLQHATMAQLLLDREGLPDSWEPYAPYESFTLHFGFPAAVAVLAWGRGISSTQATLLMGQVLNGLAVLAVYPLAVRLGGGKRWAGVLAILVGGLLSPMPAYYVNWGRFAQLAGQAVLPVAMWLTWEAAESNRSRGTAIALAAMAVAGMALDYFRMPFYFAVWVLAWLVGWGVPRLRASPRQWLTTLGRLAMIAAAAALLLLPAAGRVAPGAVASGLAAGVGKVFPLAKVMDEYRLWRDVAFYVPAPLIAIALAALLWSVARHRWAVASLGLWVAGMASLVAGRLVGLPGANMMQSFAILILLYIPVSLLAGWLGGEVAAGMAGRVRPWAIVLVLILGGGWAATRQARIVRPASVMVTQPDVRAMAWIRDNTPPDALFLVEGFRIYEGTSAVGADAGWWIPLLGGRRTTMPPQYALLAEEPAQPDYSRRVTELVALLETNAPGSEKGLAALCEWGITHAYVGQAQGTVGAGATALFTPEALLESPAFRPVYHEDRVWVFALDPTACGTGR